MWMVSYICPVQTDCWHVSISICVGVCIALWIRTNKGQQLWRPRTCIGLTLWCEMWFSCTIGQPGALKTKISIEPHTTVHYLLTPCSIHCLMVVLLMWLKTSSLTLRSFPFVSCFLLSSAVSVRWIAIASLWFSCSKLYSSFSHCPFNRYVCPSDLWEKIAMGESS